MAKPREDNSARVARVQELRRSNATRPKPVGVARKERTRAGQRRKALKEFD